MISAFRSAITPRSTLSPSEWCEAHIVLPRSTDSAKFRSELTPWWPEVMDAIADDRNAEVCIVGPVGCGKSTLLEAMTCWVVSEKPGPMLITGQTDSDVCDWAETGLWPAMRGCAPIARKLPTARGKMRKGEAILPSMDIHLTGANMSGLQSKSKVWVWGDEAWMWRQGMIQEFRKRTHRRWNARTVLLGQAGFLEEGDDGEPVGDDFTLAASQGQQREWCFSCPACDSPQPYSLGQLRFPETGTISQRALACEYVCVSCGEHFPDTAQSRRAFSSRSEWVVMRPAEMPGHITFHLNALALFRSPWSAVVAEFLSATAAMRQGNSLPLQQFTQKQLAEPWKDSMSISRPDLDVIEGKVEDFAKGEKIDGETIRFLTIDVQRDHFWVLCRAWRGDASSVVVYYGTVQTAETIERLRAVLGVEAHRTYIDCGYDAGTVYDYCARFGWVALKGDGSQEFSHKVKRAGKVTTALRPISPVRMVLAPCNKRVPLVHVATDPLKDILARLRGGQAAPWQAVSDIGLNYVKQLDAEAREEFLAPKTNQPVARWVRKHRHNHAWDCEVYQVAAALIWRVFAE